MTAPVFKPTPSEIIEILNTLPTDHQDYGLQLMGVPSFWKNTMGEGVLVAVLDTGIDIKHPDLEHQVKYARNFTTLNIADFKDRQGHGTHCAGIVAASADGKGMVGTAPGAKLVIGKVLGDDGTGDFNAINSGIRWAIKQKVDVISMSLGCSKEFGNLPALHYAIKEAYDAGIEIVAAAGNDGVNNSAVNTTDYPAAYDECWCVGAVDPLKRHASFSSEGIEVDVCAPGVKVISTFPGGRYVKMSGTSMATPYFAGVLALIISQFKKEQGRKPSHSEVQALVQVHCEDLGALNKDASYGMGLFNFDYTRMEGIEK